MIGAELGGGLVPACEAAVLVDRVEDPTDERRRHQHDGEDERQRGAADHALVGEIQEAAQRARGMQDEPAFLLLRVERRAALSEHAHREVREQAGGDHQPDDDENGHEILSRSRWRTINAQNTP